MSNAHYQQSFGGEISPSGELSVRVAKLLSISILELAQKVLHRCKRRKRQDQVSDILEVYILVAVSLEAFINEICLEKIAEAKELGNNTANLENTMYGNNGRGLEIQEKWDRVPKCLWGKSLDKGRLPWQDFDTLINLRNALVHYKAEYKDPQYVPKYLESTMRRVLSCQKREPQPPGFLEGLLKERTHWVNKICNLSMGYWALDTGIKMIHQFLGLADPQDRLRQDYTSMLERSKVSAAWHRVCQGLDAWPS